MQVAEDERSEDREADDQRASRNHGLDRRTLALARIEAPCNGEEDRCVADRVRDHDQRDEGFTECAPVHSSIVGRGSAAASMLEPVPAIEIEHLRVVRGGKVVLSDLTLGVEAGTVTGLLGPSGSGKTTLMRAIVGVQIVAVGPGRRARASGGVAGGAGARGVPDAGAVGLPRPHSAGEPRLLRARACRPSRADRPCARHGRFERPRRAHRSDPLGRRAFASLARDRPARRAGGADSRRADGRARPGASARPLGDVSGGSRRPGRRCSYPRM